MQSLQSNALDPTKSEMNGLSFSQKLGRMLDAAAAGLGWAQVPVIHP